MATSTSPVIIIPATKPTMYKPNEKKQTQKRKKKNFKIPTT